MLHHFRGAITKKGLLYQNSIEYLFLKNELKDFHEVSIRIQTNNPADVTMAMTRFYFDKLMTQHKRDFPDIVEHLESNLESNLKK